MAGYIGPFLSALLLVVLVSHGVDTSPACPDTWDDAGLIGLNDTFYPVDLENDGPIVVFGETTINISSTNAFGMTYDALRISADGRFSFVVPDSDGSANFLYPYSCGFGLERLPDLPVAFEPSNEGIYFNETTDSELLCRFGAHVQNQNLAPNTFTPTHLLIITWYGVGCNFFLESDTLSDPTFGEFGHTYQAVVGSDGERTFVCFIYGIIPFVPMETEFGFEARAGVNIDGGLYQFIIPLEDITEIDSVEGNTGQVGKWIFQIHGDVFNPVPCFSGSLVLSTRSASQCGGKMITLFGPCYDNSPGVKCDFGGTIVDGVIVDPSRAYCITPFVTTFGSLTLRVSIDNGITYNYSALFYIYSRDFGYEIIRQNPLAWLSPPFAPLSFEWPTFGVDQLVNVDVGEFTLDGTIGSIIRIITETENDGFETIDEDLPEVSSPELILFCALRITPANVSFPQVALWSDFFPCCWYSAKLLYKISQNDPDITNAQDIRNIINEALGPSPSRSTIEENLRDVLNRAVAEEICTDWIDFENDDPVIFSLPKPPCTRDDAIRDRRYSERCFGDECEFYHPGARSCFIPWIGFPHGQEVCYDEDGVIITTGEDGGGTADRVYHPWGITLEHIRHDLLPYVACCKYSYNCGAYFNRRPTDDCDGYVPPRPIWWWGDPHLATFDGRIYTFNPVGEFWLVLNSVFMLQARMKPFNLAANRATIISAIAVKKGSSAEIEISLDDSLNFVVKVDGQEEDLTGFINNVFPTPDNMVHILKLSADEIHVRFQVQGNSPCDGEVLRILKVFGTLRVDTLLPMCYNGVVTGLLGNFDDDATNEFRTRPGNLVPDTASPQDIHAFGLTWRVTAFESLFTYGVGESHQSVNDLTYIPQFFTDAQLLITPGGGFCNGNLQCLYDFRVTGNRQFAEATLEAAEEVRELFDLFRSATNPCLSDPCVTGVCTPSSTPNMTIFTCACPPGFSGILCEEDNCNPDPCQNGGTCQGDTSVTRYNCLCPPTFTGPNCQTRVAVCDRSPCLNGGTCQFIGSHYVCTCPAGYTGIYCEGEESACDPNPCENDGVCSLTYSPRGYSCQCKTGFTGGHCQTEIDPCDSEPCLNGGVCSQTYDVTEFSCKCQPAYTGTTCQTAICDPNPCKNGATCETNEKGNTRCICPPGYAGIHCHISPDNLRNGIIASLVLFFILALSLLATLLIILCHQGVNCCGFPTTWSHGHPQPVGVVKARAIRSGFNLAPRLRPLHVKNPVFRRPARYW